MCMNTNSDWDSVAQCLAWIRMQDEPVCAMLAVVSHNIGVGEDGFATEVFNGFMSAKGATPALEQVGDLKSGLCTPDESTGQGMTANLTEFSIDDGQTWNPVNNAVRVIFREVGEDDEGFQDLHVSITHEGLVFDVVDQGSGAVTMTASKLAIDIPDELQ